MTIREQSEQLEVQTLSSLAAKSACSKGRLRPEEPCTVRTDFQRDRDRIIHSKAFRRLMHKTQVFIAPEGDHFRTRLTHTLEVSQIARTIARGLRLNEDLTESIALGHDLGHTPFGHGGERALQQLFPGGFAHNEQSLRVVDVLERDRRGLNLTHEVRDGILCHTDDQLPETLEGRIVRLADRIAYVNHDIDDACRAGVLDVADLTQEALDVLGRSHKQRINTLVLSAIERSATDIMLAPAVLDALETLREDLFRLVYRSERAQREEEKTNLILRTLYTYFCTHLDKLPEEYRAALALDGVDRVVCDYIAGMSDRFAISAFSRLTLPSALKENLDELF